MIPYHVVLFSGEKPTEKFSFETNEKPFKGETFVVQKHNGSIDEVMIVEVTKMIVEKDKSHAVLEYHCKTELHEQRANAIGFGNR